MAVEFKLKRSSVSGRVPATSSIDYGELAINTYDGILYLKKNDGNGDSVVPIQQVTEYNFAIDNSPFSNTSSNNLSGVLRDLDRAITTNQTFQIGADDSTLRSVGAGESVLFLGSGSVTTTTDAEGNITIDSSDTLTSVTTRNSTTTNAITVGGLSIGTEFTFPTVDGANGQTLVTDGNGNVYWATLSGAGGAATLDGLLDVDTTTTTPSVGQVLKYNGTNWVPADSGSDTVLEATTVSKDDDVFAISIIMG